MNIDLMQKEFEAWWNGRRLPKGLKSAFYMVWQAALAAQAQQSQWISVEERLPEEGITVLVVTNFGDVYTCRLPVIIAKNSKEESPVGKRERFTHWMPLSPAPEGDKE